MRGVQQRVVGTKPLPDECDVAGPSGRGRPKWFRPKVMLIDIDAKVGEALRGAGYNVTEGSFGRPYLANQQGSAEEIRLNGVSLEGYEDRDIYIIDLSTAQDEEVSMPTADRWMEPLYTVPRGPRGIVDPRPVAAKLVHEGLDLALEQGGAAFIVFADPPVVTTVGPPSMQSPRLGWSETRVDECCSWQFLSQLRLLDIEAHYGDEMTVVQGASQLLSLLRQHIGGSRYTCTLRLWHGRPDRHIPLVTEKYSRVVGALLTSADGKGRVLVLPQIQNKASLVLDLLERYLSDCCPHLFPEAEGGRWVEQDAYELRDVVELKADIRRVQQQAAKSVEELENRIRGVRAELGWLHTLLTGTDRALVLAVKRALEELGFKRVVDVDVEDSTSKGKREDLRIEDSSPLLLVEVKGISGIPTEADSLQALKYVSGRMRALKRFDIRSLTIVNQQRHLPALDRQNENVFTPDVLATAEEQNLGLLAAWDLFRLVRGFMRFGWSPDDVRSLFYQPGRIRPVPRHYAELGEVTNLAPDLGVVGVTIRHGSLRLGDRIAYSLPADYEEQEVTSLEVDRQPAAMATVGQVAGIKSPLVGSGVRVGLTVYLVHSRQATTDHL